MTRPLLVVLLALGMSSAGFAAPAVRTLPDAGALSKACYAQVGPALQSVGRKLTP